MKPYLFFLTAALMLTIGVSAAERKQQLSWLRISENGLFSAENVTGRIVVISSASGQAGQAGQVNYSASKAALIGAVKALAREIGRKGILVNAVAPGFIETAMTAELPKEKILPMIPLNRAGTPEEVAGAVSFLCGPDSRYVHGQVLAVNGGLVI